MRLAKLGNILQVVVFVCPPPTRTRTQEYICKNIKQDIRVSNTPFSKNQTWMRDSKHSSVFSSLDTLFHFYLLQGQMETTRILSTCSRMFNFAIENKVCFFWASKTKDQCTFQLKPSKLCFFTNYKQTRWYTFYFKKIVLASSTWLSFMEKRLRCISFISYNFFLAKIVMFYFHCFGFVHWKLYFCLFCLGVIEFFWTKPSSYIWNYNFFFFVL